MHIGRKIIMLLQNNYDNILNIAYLLLIFLSVYLEDVFLKIL